MDKEEGRVLSGFEDAIAAIHANQNPPDCTTASYIITRVESSSSDLLLNIRIPFAVFKAWHQGFGSEFHYHGD